MKIESIPNEPIQVAVAAAVVANAWPKFVSSEDGKKPAGDGEFSMPVGHYIGLAPDELVLSVSVALTGSAYELEGGSWEGPGETLTKHLAAKLWSGLHENGYDSRTVSASFKTTACSSTARYFVAASGSATLISKPVPATEDEADDGLPLGPLKNCWKPVNFPAVSYTWEQFKDILDAGFAKHAPVDPDTCGGFIDDDKSLSAEQIAAELTEAMNSSGVPLPAEADDVIGCFLLPEALDFLLEMNMDAGDFWRILSGAKRQAQFEKVTLPFTRNQLEIGNGPQMC